jgi:chitinase
MFVSHSIIFQQWLMLTSACPTGLQGDAAGCSCSAAVINPPSPTTTSSQLMPTVTRSLARCCQITDGVIVPLWYDVTIYANDEWIADGGTSLLNQERGCGVLTEWSAQEVSTWIEDEGWEASYAFTFHLPLIMADGCIERAIVSAGGPPIQCTGGSTVDNNSCSFPQP